MKGRPSSSGSQSHPLYTLAFPRPFICCGCQRALRITTLRSQQQSQYSLFHRRYQSSWAQAKAIAHSVLDNGQKPDPIFAGVAMDPLRIVGEEMKFLTKNLQQLLGSGHPILDTVAKYYTLSEGKNIRPLLVLLMSRATARLPKVHPSITNTPSTIDDNLSPSWVLTDVNPYSPLSKTRPDSSFSYSHPDAMSDILPSQRRLAEITELIHTASLLHDDVIDNSVSRRSQDSANVKFGNKMAVLAGDFLLGRASAALARLRDAEVIELLATVIANLVEGEFMQLRNTALDEPNPVWTEETLSYYLQKTYLKSASLISKSCRAAALLGHNAPFVVEAAYAYGRNLGLAFQLVDDMLDYTTSATELGKPAGADLQLGLATAPLLFAWKTNKDLGLLVGRKFAGEGDVLLAREMVARSDGVEETKKLAQDFADKAVAAIDRFPACDAKDGLVEMCINTMKRKK